MHMLLIGQPLCFPYFLLPLYSVLTGGATLASGANYFFESGLKPTEKLGERLVLRRETLRERCLETGALVKEQVDMSRKQFRIKKVGIPRVG